MDWECSVYAVHFTTIYPWNLEKQLTTGPDNLNDGTWADTHGAFTMVADQRALILAFSLNTAVSIQGGKKGGPIYYYGAGSLKAPIY